MIERTEEHLASSPHGWAADSAYGSAPTLQWLVDEKQIAPRISTRPTAMSQLAP
jgi:hypothetical protein